MAGGFSVIGERVALWWGISRLRFDALEMTGAEEV